jgi:hypothetical protein
MSARVLASELVIAIAGVLAEATKSQSFYRRST